MMVRAGIRHTGTFFTLQAICRKINLGLSGYRLIMLATAVDWLTRGGQAAKRLDSKLQPYATGCVFVCVCVCVCVCDIMIHS